MSRSVIRALLLLVVAAAGFYALRQDGGSRFGTLPETSFPDSGLDSSARAGERAVLDAFAERRSNVVVELYGTVQRVLDDDEQGSRHQRFILELPGAHTVLVSHNIDLAPRVPIARGDAVRVRGEYEWNERGGVLHWTHHDPRGDREGGWIRHERRTYR